MKLEKTRDPELFINKDSGIYYYRGTPIPGRGEKFKSLKVDSMGLAVSAKKTFFLTLSGAKSKVPGTITMRELSAAIVKEYEDRIQKAPERFHHKIKRTLAGFNHYRVKHFDPFFGDNEPKDVTEGRFQDYLAQAHERSLQEHGKPRGFHHDRRYLMQILAKAKKDGLILKAPEFVLPDADKWLSAEKKNEKIKIFTPEEIKKLFEVATGNVKAFILLGYKMGLRPIEALGTAWSQVDFEKGLYEITVEQAKRNKKKSAARVIALNPSCLAYLANLKAARSLPFDSENVHKSRRARQEGYWERAKASPWIFCHPKKPEGYIKRIDDSWRRLLARCKIEYRHPYNLRHTVITEAVRRMGPGKATLPELAKYFGTSVSEIEGTYLHLVHEDTKHISEIMDIEGAI